jgi:hypothetical protein
LARADAELRPVAPYAMSCRLPFDLSFAVGVVCADEGYVDWGDQRNPRANLAPGGGWFGVVAAECRSAMEYAEWQLTRLRNALRAFHKHGRHEVEDADEPKRKGTNKRERRLNWKYVAAEIWDAAGPGFLGLTDDRDTDNRRKRIKQFAERLRQFVEGNRNPDGVQRRKFQRMQPDSLAAIVKFVTGAGLLTGYELYRCSSLTAPIRRVAKTTTITNSRFRS